MEVANGAAAMRETLRVLSLVLLAAAAPAIAHAQECDPVATGPAASLAATGATVDDATARVIADARAATERSIVAIRGQLDETSQEISSLENANAAKQQTANGLVAQIQSRQQQVKANYDRTRTIGILGALFGVPAIAAMSVVQMYDQDAMLKQLNAQLASAQADQARVAAQIAAQQHEKDVLELKLRVLRRGAAKLSATPAAPLAVTPGMEALAAAKAQLDARTALLANLRDQLSVLQQIRADAAGVGVALDAEIAALQESVAKAEKIVAASNKELFELVKALVAPDPQAAATKWLNSTVAHRLVQQALPQGGPAAQMLERQILQSMKPAAPAADDPE